MRACIPRSRIRGCLQANLYELMCVQANESQGKLKISIFSTAFQLNGHRVYSLKPFSTRVRIFRINWVILRISVLLL